MTDATNPFDTLLDTWIAWDTSPRNPQAAAALTTAIHNFADAYGLHATHLRQTMAHHRRQGHAHDTALDHILQAARTPAA